MPFLFIFGLIMFLISIPVMKFRKKEVDPTSCETVASQERDIRNSKKIATALQHGGLTLAAIGGIGSLIWGGW